METSDILRIGRDFQNSDKFRGCTFDTAKLLCDEIERLSRELESERSKGNCAKLREAAVTVYNVLEKLRPFILRLSDVRLKREFSHLVCLAKNRLDAALAEPPRNCDVGTAEEQVKRWEKFCTAHHKKWIGGKIPTGPCECPCYEGNSCNYFVWAQLPYESEAAE